MITQLATEIFKETQMLEHITKLAANIKTIEKVRLTIADVPFSPFFYLKLQMRSSIINLSSHGILNWIWSQYRLDDVRLIDTLV